MSEPRDKRKESDQTFLPKRWIHTWSGHTKVRPDSFLLPLFVCGCAWLRMGWCAGPTCTDVHADSCQASLRSVCWACRSTVC